VTAGGGTLYLADDFSSLPQVSIAATQRLSREETTQTLLWGGEDPLVSTWRVGLGSITVVSTDLSGAWTQQWFEWPGLPRLFEGILATIESTTDTALGLTAIVSFEGSTTSILVDARDDNGRYANFLDIEADVLPIDVTIPLTQVSPGLYQGSIPTPAKGGYTVQILDHTRDRSMSVPLTVPYAWEVADISQNLETLRWIATTSNGVVLENGTSLPQADERLTLRIDPLHMLFILAAVILFLLELIIRKWPVQTKSQRAAE